MNTKVKYQPVSISLPKDILNKIDIIARESYKSRSDVIREAVIGRAISTYEPTKEENIALAHAQKDINKGNVTSWDDFVNLK